jgi:hypothetical protein
LRILKTKARLVIAIVTILISVAVAAVYLIRAKKRPQPANTPLVVQNTQGLRLEIPDARWEPSFFEALEERTKKVNLPSLRTVVLPEHDLEVRFWYDASPSIINGFVIRRSGDQWSAIGIRQTNQGQALQVKQENLGVPKSGWEAAWKRLVSAGILTLPDGSTLECYSGALDGGGYVVETNVNRVYRTYRYGNPQLAKCDGAKGIVLIEGIIGDEFSLLSPQK